jgi:hypothetical protein
MFTVAYTVKGNSSMQYRNFSVYQYKLYKDFASNPDVTIIATMA